MVNRPTRRQFAFGLLGLAVAGCAPAPAASLAPASPLPTPDLTGGGLALLLVPGLALEDMLLGANVGELPHLAAMIESGLLVEHLTSEDTWLTPEESAAQLLGGVPFQTMDAGCAAWRWDGSAVPEGCPWPGELQPAVQQWVADCASACEAMAAQMLAAGSGAWVLPLDGLMRLQVAHLMADAAQLEYSIDAALAFAQQWRLALGALDASLGALMQTLDLSRWALALAALGEAWPVGRALDLDELAGAVLAGGSLVDVPAGTPRPEGEGWAEVTTAPAPVDAARERWLAPAEWAFVPVGQTPPRAVLHPGGWLLARGRGLSVGERQESVSLGEAAGVLAGLA